MDRVMILCLAILCWKTCIIQGIEPTQVEENQPATIEYVTSAKIPQIRYWYRGYNYDGNNPAKSDDLLFILFPGDPWKNGSAAHSDMFANPDNYSLTISNVYLEDNGFFTCKTYDTDTNKNVYDLAGELQVYTQPVVYITDDWVKGEEKDVTVTCTIPRLFPTITHEKFKMKWGENVINANFLENAIDGDCAKMYTLSVTYKPEKGNQTIKCTVTPTSGLGIRAFNQTTIYIDEIATLNLDVGGNAAASAAYMEGPVNVSCTLTDGFPQVDLSSFKIDWGDQKYDSWKNTTGPTDKYKSYIIKKLLTLTTSDNNRVVSCSATLTDGTSLTPSSSPKTLHVWRPPPKHDLSDGGIAGIVIGSMAGGGLIGAGIVFGLMKKKTKEPENK